MISTLAALGPWSWLIFGVALIGLELLAPGIFLIWIGLAALATGAIVGLTGISWQFAALVFASLAVIAVLASLRLTARPGATREPAAELNARDRNLIGRIVELERPITGGEGQINIDDSIWRIKGEDMPAGSSIRIIRPEGTLLWVERV
jgi:inner membrane protein